MMLLTLNMKSNELSEATIIIKLKNLNRPIREEKRCGQIKKLVPWYRLVPKKKRKHQ